MSRRPGGPLVKSFGLWHGSVSPSLRCAILEAVSTVAAVSRLDLSQHVSVSPGKALHQRTAGTLGALLCLVLWSAAVPSAALGSGEAGGDADDGVVGPLVQRLGVKDRKVARRAMRRLVKFDPCHAGHAVGFRHHSAGVFG